VGKIEKKSRTNEGKKGKREEQNGTKCKRGDHPSNHEKLKMKMSSSFSMKSPAVTEGEEISWNCWKRNGNEQRMETIVDGPFYPMSADYVGNVGRKLREEFMELLCGNWRQPNLCEPNRQIGVKTAKAQKGIV
jgi:hypothetical protein